MQARSTLSSTRSPAASEAWSGAEPGFASMRPLRNDARVLLLDVNQAYADAVTTVFSTPIAAKAWFATAADASTPGVRSARQAEHLAFSRTERANIDAALAWTATHDPLLGLRIVSGFGWSWVVLGDHFHFSVTFLFDRLSIPLTILSYVLCGTIGAFAGKYMHREPGFNRFFGLYAVFRLGMVWTIAGATAVGLLIYAIGV